MLESFIREEFYESILMKYFNFLYFIQHDIKFKNHLHGNEVFPNAHQHHGTENINSNISWYHYVLGNRHVIRFIVTRNHLCFELKDDMIKALSI